MSNSIQEIIGGVLVIKGNLLRYQNNFYSIKNIVSISYDKIIKDNPEPISIKDNVEKSKFFFKYFIFSLISTIVIISFDLHIPENYKNLFFYFILSIPISLIISIFFLFLSKFVKWTYKKTYEIEGLKIVFTNNTILYFASKKDNKFISKTLKVLNEILEQPDMLYKKEVVIDFSTKNIQIENIKNSNVNTGFVNGNMNNGIKNTDDKTSLEQGIEKIDIQSKSGKIISSVFLLLLIILYILTR